MPIHNDPSETQYGIITNYWSLAHPRIPRHSTALGSLTRVERPHGSNMGGHIDLMRHVQDQAGHLG